MCHFIDIQKYINKHKTSNTGGTNEFRAANQGKDILTNVEIKVVKHTINMTVNL